MTQTETTASRPAPDDWLAEIKARDTVIIASDHERKLSKVSRCTATQIVIPHGLSAEWKFRRRDGDLVGRGEWDTTRLVEATPEAVAKVQHANRARYLSRYTAWNKLPAEVVAQVYAMVQAAGEGGGE